MSETLKKCPFCGGGALSQKVIDTYLGESGYKIGCVSCSITLAIIDSEQEAIEAWNARSYEEREQKLIEALKDLALENGEPRASYIAQTTLKELEE